MTDSPTLIFSQWARYAQIFMLFFLLRDAGYNKGKKDYIVRFFLEIMVIQIVLSVCKFENSVACELTDFQISTDRKSRNGKVLFSTVYSFKGLESPVVVLVDFDNINYEQKMNLLYVGMTRARSALYMVMYDKARQVLEKRILETANNGCPAFMHR